MPIISWKADVKIHSEGYKHMNGVLAKILAWVQFGAQTAAQVSASGGSPHGWAQWLVLAGSLGAAVGIHAASNVGQIASPSASSAEPVSTTGHVKQ